MTKKIQDQRQHGENKKPNYDIEHMNLKHITNDKNISKTVYEYVDMDNDELTWMDENKLKRIAAELIEWAKTQPSATQMQKFFDTRGMAHKVVSDWRRKWPWFGEKCTHAKNIIASRLFDGGLVKSYAEGIVKLALPMNSEEWKEEGDRLVKLRIELQNAEPVKTQTFTVLKVKHVTQEEMDAVEDPSTLPATSGKGKK